MLEQNLIPRRGLAMLALAMAHLVCVVLGAFQVNIPYDSVPGKAFARYAALTGADSTFGFFAPTVGTQLRMMIEITDRDGTTVDKPFQFGGNNREIALRLSNAVALFWIPDENLRRTLSASIAGKFLATHPEATSAAVRVEILDLPTMKDHLEGKRPSWLLHYRAKYVARADRTERKEAEQ